VRFSVILALVDLGASGLHAMTRQTADKSSTAGMLNLV
jgi:hypothetical protein